MGILCCDCLNPDSSIIQLVSSLENLFPELVIPYIELFSLNGLPKKLAYSGNYYQYILSNFTKFYVLHWLVEILEWNTTGVLLIYDWKNLLRNILQYSLMMLDTRCLQYFIFLPVSSYHNYQLLPVKTSVRLDFCLIDIHVWCHWIFLLWVIQ